MACSKHSSMITRIMTTSTTTMTQELSQNSEEH